MWVQGSELRYSGRAGSAVNHCSTSSVPRVYFKDIIISLCLKYVIYFVSRTENSVVVITNFFTVYQKSSKSWGFQTSDKCGQSHLN